MGKDAGTVANGVWLYWQDDPTEELATSGELSLGPSEILFISCSVSTSNLLMLIGLLVEVDHKETMHWGVRASPM